MEHEHIWDYMVPAVATHGPLEGEWLIEDCTACAAFRLSRADGEDPAPNLSAASAWVN